LSKECFEGKSCCQDRRIPSFLLDNPFRYLLFNPGKVAKHYASEGYTVADLGSGPGFYTIAFAKRVGEKGKVYAVDFDVDSIKKLILKAKKEKLKMLWKLMQSMRQKLTLYPIHPWILSLPMA